MAVTEYHKSTINEYVKLLAIIILLATTCHCCSTDRGITTENQRHVTATDHTIIEEREKSGSATGDFVG